MKAITNSELPEVRELLIRLNGVPNIKLAYATAKSIIKIDQEIRDLLEIRKEDPDYVKYLGLLEEIKRKHAVKRPDGQPATRIETVRNQSYEVYDIIPESIKSYQSEVEALDVKFKKAIDKQKTKEENYQKILAEPTNVALHKVDHSEIKPLLEKDAEGKATLSGAQFVGLAHLLKTPVSLEMVPEDITAPDMKILIEHFEV